MSGHAQRILAQLEAVEGDDSLPEDLRESARERAEEIEAEQEGDD